MGSSSPIAIFGAGGFAREVAWLLPGSVLADRPFAGFIDDSRAGATVLEECPVLPLVTMHERFPDMQVLVGIGACTSRRRVCERLDAVGIRTPVLRHHSVQQGGRVTVGDGSILCQNVVLTVDIEIGRHVHLNIGCTVGHDARIGAFSTLAPGVHVSGCVHIGEGVQIGTGVAIINGETDRPLVIGDGSVIGAGACVTRSLEPDGLYAGVPAVLKKRLADRGLPAARDAELTA